MGLMTTDTITDFSSILRFTIACPQKESTPRSKRLKRKEVGKLTLTAAIMKNGSHESYESPRQCCTCNRLKISQLRISNEGGFRQLNDVFCMGSDVWLRS